MTALRDVVVICHQYPPWNQGGLDEYAERSLHFARRHRADLRFTLYTMNYPDDHPRRSVQDGVTVVRPRMPGWLKKRMHSPAGAGIIYFGLALLVFNLGAALGLSRMRRGETIIAAHDWQSTPAGILAALLGFRVAYHVHNTEQTMTPKPDVGDPLRLIRTCQRLLSAVATLIVAPTPEMRALLVRHGWRGDRIRVVPHGYEDVRAVRAPGLSKAGARAELRAATGFPADSRLLVFVGRLAPTKGVRTLLRAMPAIRLRHPDVRLLVLGVGFAGSDQDAVVDRLVAELDIADSTHVYHRHLSRDEVLTHYLAADLCAFPSTYEPFGLVALEAMSLGVPVVLGPGFSELIGAGGAAFRQGSDSVDELAGLICSALDDPTAAVEVGERGRRHVRESFGWSTSVTELVAAYEEVLVPRGVRT